MSNESGSEFLAGLRHMKVQPIKVGEGVWMLPSFGNTGLVETREGLVVVDAPLPMFVEPMVNMLRQVSKDPVHTIFLTHGHLDHGACLNALFEDAEKNGFPPPRIVAQRNILKRFQKYRMLDGYHEHINRIQFGIAGPEQFFPMPQRNPDVVFDQSLSTRVGGLDFHAFHELGETDDHLWVWVPEKKTALSGDMVLASFPNVGNPFKVQRYTLEWAEGIERILAREPEVLIPGHGPELAGRDAIRQTLLKISAALRYLHTEVVGRLNAGMWYEDILHDVQLPPEMMDDFFLEPRYGCPTFVVHGILRQYTGWYDGNPSNLFPPKRADIHREITAMVGKAAIMDRAAALAEQDRPDMALQFVDMALAAALDPDETKRMHGLKSELLGRLGDQEPSFIARNIFYRGRDREKELTEKT